MKTVNDYDINLNDLYENFSGKLLMAEIFDEKAYFELYDYLVIIKEQE